MLEVALLLAIVAVGVFGWRHRRRPPAPHPPPPDAEYVCHWCGEHDCICKRKPHPPREER